jgi:hypothetical protein
MIIPFWGELHDYLLDQLAKPWRSECEHVSELRRVVNCGGDDELGKWSADVVADGEGGYYGALHLDFILKYSQISSGCSPRPGPIKTAGTSSSDRWVCCSSGQSPVHHSEPLANLMVSFFNPFADQRTVCHI